MPLSEFGPTGCWLSVRVGEWERQGADDRMEQELALQAELAYRRLVSD
jgi:hypothetical protein